MWHHCFDETTKHIHHPQHVLYGTRQMTISFLSLLINLYFLGYVCVCVYTYTYNMTIFLSISLAVYYLFIYAVDGKIESCHMYSLVWLLSLFTIWDSFILLYVSAVSVCCLVFTSWIYHMYYLLFTYCWTFELFSNFWILWIKQLWAFMYSSPCGHVTI